MHQHPVQSLSHAPLLAPLPLHPSQPVTATVSVPTIECTIRATAYTPASFDAAAQQAFIAALQAAVPEGER